MGIIRAEVVARMRGAISEGLSASRFIRNMKEAGLSYRRTDMFADWRNLKKLDEREGLLRYVRKDRYPTEKIIATTTWNLAKEYMYVVKVKTQTSPDDPVISHEVSIQTDIPMTPAMITERLLEERIKEEKYFGEIVVEVEPFTAIRKVS